MAHHVEVIFTDGSSQYGSEDDWEDSDAGMTNRVDSPDTTYYHFYPWHRIKMVYIKVPK